MCIRMRRAAIATAKADEMNKVVVCRFGRRVVLVIHNVGFRLRTAVICSTLEGKSIDDHCWLLDGSG